MTDLHIKKIKKASESIDFKEDKVIFVGSQMLVGKTTVMKIFQVTERTLHHWETRGFEISKYSVGSVKLYDIFELRLWYNSNIDQSRNAKNNLKVKATDKQNSLENEFEGVSLDSVPITEAQRRKEIEAVKKLVLQNKLISGESIDIEDVDRNLATQAATHIAHLTNSEKILPDLLEHKDSSDIQDIINEHNQMSIEHLYQLTNKEISGDHELYDVYFKMLKKYNDGATLDSIVKMVDKIVIP